MALYQLPYRPIRRLVVVAAAMLPLYAPVATAALDSRQPSAATEQARAQATRDKLLRALDRHDIRAHLIALGISPRTAQARVASLSDEDVLFLSDSVNDLPPDSDEVATRAFVFLVLMNANLLRQTNIFATDAKAAPADSSAPADIAP